MTGSIAARRGILAGATLISVGLALALVTAASVVDALRPRTAPTPGAIELRRATIAPAPPEIEAAVVATRAPLAASPIPIAARPRPPVPALQPVAPAMPAGAPVVVPTATSPEATTGTEPRRLAAAAPTSGQHDPEGDGAPHPHDEKAAKDEGRPGRSASHGSHGGRHRRR